MKIVLPLTIVVMGLFWLQPSTNAGLFEEAEPQICVELSLTGRTVYYYQTCIGGLSYCTPTYAPCQNGIPVTVGP